MAWAFEDQASDYTRGILAKFEKDDASVPSIWPLEVANALAVAERRRTISRAGAEEFVEGLGSLAIFVAEDTHKRALREILALAREQSVSAYDASYLELAMRLGAPLATRDKGMAMAARRLGIRRA